MVLGQVWPPTLRINADVMKLTNQRAVVERHVDHLINGKRNNGKMGTDTVLGKDIRILIKVGEDMAVSSTSGKL